MQKGNHDYEKSAIERMKKNKKEEGKKNIKTRHIYFTFFIIYTIDPAPLPSPLLPTTNPSRFDAL